MLNFGKKSFIKNISLKSLNNFSTSFTGFSQKVYQKIVVTRLPHQTYTLFLDTNDSVSVLFKHLNKLFPESKFTATNNFQNKLSKPITPEDIQLNQQISKLQLIQLLLHSNITIYEQINNRFNLCLGIQMKQYNLTNNRNLPEHIAANIIELSQQWKQNKSIEKVLDKSQGFDELEHKKFVQEKQQLNSQAQLAYANYLQLWKFYQKQYIDSGKARSLMANLIALQTVNWGFLFAVTYGKYGWDVGEPLSYLTSLGVELIAMMGIFQMDQTVQKTGKQDFINLSAIMNLQSQIKMRQFQLSYCKRNY